MSKYCSKCGKENNDSNVLCDNCGNNINNNETTDNNLNQSTNLKQQKNKNFEHYKKLLTIDTIILTILSSIGIVMGSIGSIEMFIHCCLYVIFMIIMLFQLKENKKFVGNFAIIVSSIIILLSIFGSSLLDIIMLVLGIFYIIHAIKYKKHITIENIENDLNTQKPKSLLPYVSLILVVLSIFFLILGAGVLSVTIVLTVVLILNIIAVILSIIAIIKKKKIAITYISIVFAVIITLGLGSVFVGFISDEISTKLYENSEQKIIDMSNTLEKDITFSTTQSYVLIKLNKKVSPTKETIIPLDETIKVIEEIRADGTSYMEDFETKGYKCEGYTVLQLNNNYTEESFYNIIYQQIDRYGNSRIDMKNCFSVAKTYISCEGKYKYETKGFDYTKLNK